MHSSRMRTARLRIDRSARMWGGRSMSFPSWGGGGSGRSMNFASWGGGGGEGRWWEVNDLSFLGGGGGWEVDVQGEWPCPGGGKVDVQGGDVVLSGGGGCPGDGPVWGVDVPPPLDRTTLRPCDLSHYVTHACENITFTRFATRAVNIYSH